MPTSEPFATWRSISSSDSAGKVRIYLAEAGETRRAALYKRRDAVVGVGEALGGGDPVGIGGDKHAVDRLGEGMLGETLGGSGPSGSSSKKKLSVDELES